MAGFFYARQAYSASRPDMLTQMFANILFQAVLPAFAASAYRFLAICLYFISHKLN